MSISRVCPECDVTFEVPCRSDTQVTCSRKCRDAALSRPAREAYEQNPRLCPCGDAIPYSHRHSRKYCLPPKNCREEYGVVGGSVVKGRRINRRKRKGPWEEDEIEQARRMYGEVGYGIAQIAQALERPEREVREVVEGLDKPARRPYRVSQEWERAFARAERAKGALVAHIAAELKRSEQTVHYWVRDIQVPEVVEVPKEAERREQQQARAAARREAAEVKRAEAVRLYQEEGRSVSWICGHLDTYEKAVKRWLADAGVEVVRKGTWEGRLRSQEELRGK